MKDITQINLRFRYKYLDTKFVGSSTGMALKKLAVDALVLTPLNITLFYTGNILSLCISYKGEARGQPWMVIQTAEK